MFTKIGHTVAQYTQQRLLMLFFAHIGDFKSLCHNMTEIMSLWSDDGFNNMLCTVQYVCVYMLNMCLCAYILYVPKVRLFLACLLVSISECVFVPHTQYCTCMRHVTHTLLPLLAV